MLEEVVLHPEAPQKLRDAPKVALLGLLGSGAMILCGAVLGPVAMWCGVIALTLVMVFSLWLFIQWRGYLRRPMLRFSDRIIRYRNVSVPWEMVSGISLLGVLGEPYVGLQLNESARDQMLERVPGSWYSRAVVRECLEKYGALPVPKAREMSPQELRSELTRYWKISRGG